MAPCTLRCPLSLCIQGYATNIAAGDYDYAGSRYGAAAELREWLATGGNWEAASGDVDATAFDVGDSESAAAPRFEPFYLLALLPLLFHA